MLQAAESIAQLSGGGLTGPVAVLSAMITPAVLISACGSLAISTANRLGRTIERTRRLSEQFTALAREAAAGGSPEVMEQIAEQRAVLFDQLERATRRSRLLQRAMMRLHMAIGAFVATSVAVGLVAVSGAHLAWIPVTLGLVGAGLLLHASALLIIESRVGLGAIQAEMDFVWRVGQRVAPAELATRRPRKGWWRRWGAGRGSEVGGPGGGVEVGEQPTRNQTPANNGLQENRG